MAADPQDPPRHAGQVVRRVLSAGTSSSTPRPRSSSRRRPGRALSRTPSGRPRAEARVFPPGREPPF